MEGEIKRTVAPGNRAKTKAKVKSMEKKEEEKTDSFTWRMKTQGLVL